MRSELEVILPRFSQVNVVNQTDLLTPEFTVPEPTIMLQTENHPLGTSVPLPPLNWHFLCGVPNVQNRMSTGPGRRDITWEAIGRKLSIFAQIMRIISKKSQTRKRHKKSNRTRIF